MRSFITISNSIILNLLTWFGFKTLQPVLIKIKNEVPKGFDQQKKS